MQLIKERQINPIESEVLARISIIRPILTSLLIGIKQDVVDEMGGINNVKGKSDKVYLDDKKNIMVCPIPYDGSFMELFYTSWGIVQQFIAADAQMPREVSLPVPADRQAVKELVVRREFPIVDVVDALEPLAQPNLTEQINQTVDLVTTKEGESILNNAIIAPVASLS